MNFTIANLAYREYDNEMVITMDRSGLLTVLTGSAFTIWQKVAARDDLSPWETRIAGDIYVKGLFDSPGRQHLQRSVPVDADTDSAFPLEAIQQLACERRIPIRGHLELTEKCNLRCRHCFCVAEKATAMKTRDALTLFSDLAKAGVLALGLTGGEIFSRPDISELLACLSDHRFALRLNSNGTLIDASMARLLAECPAVHRVHISLYAATAEVHDHITAEQGSFAKTIRAIHDLHDAGVFLRINTVVMRSNWSCFRDVERLVGIPLGIPVHYDPIIVPRDDGDTNNLGERINEEKMSEFLSWHTPGKGLAIKKQCHAALSFFAISANGNLYPCLRGKRTFQEPIGNVFKTPFHELWASSPRLQELRGAIEECRLGNELCDV